MYGNRRNSGIPIIRTYEQAHAYWKGVVPIRGRSPECKPLGKRSGTHHRIQKTREGAIECIEYNTAVVTFHENGEVEIKENGYPSTSTANFISEVLGISCLKTDGSIAIGVGSKEYRVGTGITIRRGRGWKLSLVKNGDIRPKYKVNRKNMNAVREKYADVYKYVKGMVKLRDGTMYNVAELRDMGYNIYDIRSTNKYWVNEFTTSMELIVSLLEDSDASTRPSRLNIFTTILAKEFGHYTWDNGGGMLLSEKQALKGLDYILMGLHRDSVLDKVEDTSPHVKRDPLRIYYGEGWNKFHELRGTA